MVKAANKAILNIIKKSLEQNKGKWAEELPKVLWAYRTTKRSSTGETSFAIVYGTKVVIPTKIGLPIL